MATEAETRAAVEAEICAWLRSNEAMGLSRRKLAAAIERGDYRDPDLATGCADDALPGDAAQWRAVADTFPAIDRMKLGKQGVG